MEDMKQLVKSARQCYAINLKHSEDSPLTRLLSVLKKLQCVTDAIKAQEAEIKRLREERDYYQASCEEGSEILGEMNALALMLLREKYPEYKNTELKTKMYSEIHRALKTIIPTDEFYSYATTQAALKGE